MIFINDEITREHYTMQLNNSTHHTLYTIRLTVKIKKLLMQ